MKTRLQNQTLDCASSLAAEAQSSHTVGAPLSNVRTKSTAAYKAKSQAVEGFIAGRQVVSYGVDD